MRAPRERAERAPLDEPVSRAEPIAQERLLALQRSAGNASVGRLLQRYRRVEPTGYTPPTGGTPFNLASPNIDLMPRPDDKPGLGIGWPGATPAHPPLHVANDNSLAINAQAGEPKEFYARADVLTNANTQLDAVKSPIELHPAGSPLTVTGVPTPLQQAQPRLRGKPPPQAGRFAELVADICREVAKQIIGGRISHARLDDRLVPINAQNSKVVSGTHELAHALSAGGAVSKDAAATAMQRGDRPASGKTYGEASQAGTTAASAAALGINEHARARIGEAYVTQTIANPEGHSEEQDFSRGGMEHATVWGYHFGAVVAESLDGVDQITLENYRRDDEIQKGAAALLERLKRDFAGQLADLAGETTSEQLGRALRKIDGKLETTREEALAAYIDLVRERIASEAELWYFRMVGGDPGQSFHEQMAQSNAFANPLTMAVTGSSEPATITFNDGESTLSQVAQNVLRGFARNYAADPHRARVRSIRVVGACPELYFESRRHTLARARADAAVNFLTPLGVPPTLFDVQTDATVYPDWEKSSRRKVECIPVRWAEYRFGSERLEELVGRLTVLRDAYCRGEPLVADAEFDALEDELRSLLAVHPELTPSPNPLEQVGAPAVLHAAVRHSRPMISLEKATKPEQVEAFFTRCPGQPVVVIPKLDALSLAVIYERGRLLRAGTVWPATTWLGLAAVALPAGASADPGTQSKLTAIAGQAAGIVAVAPTAHDVVSPDTFDVPGTVNVHDAAPNTTFTVLRRVDLNPDGVCTGATWLMLPQPNEQALTTSNGGAGALHFEISRGAPSSTASVSTCSGASRGTTAPSSRATASPSP